MATNKWRSLSAGALKLQQCGQRWVMQTLSRQWLLRSRASQDVPAVNKNNTACASPLQQHHAASSHLYINRNRQNSDVAATPTLILTARPLSTNTKSGWNPSPRAPESHKEDSSSSSAHARGDKWRKEFQEKQADRRKKFDNVKAPPAIKHEDWWTPDPLTGVYVPEYYHGCVTTARRETRRKPSGIAASYERSDTELDQNQAPWFGNMEELPDMERHKKN